MRLMGSFQTITIQGTSACATSSRSGARSRTGAVVLMLLMPPMVANPPQERKGPPGPGPPGRPRPGRTRPADSAPASPDPPGPSGGGQPALVAGAQRDPATVEVLQQGDDRLAGGAQRASRL